MSIKDKLSAARAGARKPNTSGDGDDLSVQIANLQRELAEARAALGEREKESTTWRTKAEQAEARYTTEKLRSSLHSAAAKANAIDPDDVVELVINRGARIDGDRVVFGQGAEAKAADEYIASLLASKPHLVRAAPVAQGSGAPSTVAVSSPTTAPAAKAPKITASPKEITDHFARQAEEIRQRAAAPKK